MGATMEARIVSTLDTLVADGVIISGPYETINHTDKGYPVRDNTKWWLKLNTANRLNP